VIYSGANNRIHTVNPPETVTLSSANSLWPWRPGGPVNGDSPKRSFPVDWGARQ